ncbi:MAG: hypothetical protein E7285_05075 [Lachnospiraceae bacterium]|nr:hypothetical protein [Lachnospiraceae bacterium]
MSKEERDMKLDVLRRVLPRKMIMAFVVMSSVTVITACAGDTKEESSMEGLTTSGNESLVEEVSENDTEDVSENLTTENLVEDEEEAEETEEVSENGVSENTTSEDMESDSEDVSDEAEESEALVEESEEEEEENSTEEVTTDSTNPVTEEVIVAETTTVEPTVAPTTSETVVVTPVETPTATQSTDLGWDQYTTAEWEELGIVDGRIPNWTVSDFNGGYTLGAYEYTSNGVPIYSRPGIRWPDYIINAVGECCTPSMTPLERANAIHHYIGDMMDYDDTLTHYTTRDAFTYGVGICSGYANAFQSMCWAAGVECDTVGGYINALGPVEGAHAWNRVLINGTYYYYDVCADGGGSNTSSNRMALTENSRWIREGVTVTAYNDIPDVL